MKTETLAKDRLGKCRYVISVTGNTLKVRMRGYGLEAIETQEITRRGSEFNFDADALKEKMVRLERRMCEFARLSTLLKNNQVTGIARTSGSSERRPARGVNPLTSLKV